MAANDYFNPPTNRPENSQTPQPYYSSYNPSQTPAPSLPPYTSQPPSRTQSTRPSDTSPVSPFEAPFDDHVYPMPQHENPHPPNSRFDSQSTIGADSAYYGQGGGGIQGSTNSFADNIPLRDHPGGPDVPPKQNSTDHVYDAADPNAPVRRNTGTLEEGPRDRGRLTGLLKKKKKIPFVTYVFTIVQIVIFIVEIVKNGKFSEGVNSELLLTDVSPTDRIPYYDQASNQPDDRPFTVRHHQHGRQIRLVHAQHGLFPEFNGY
jgi:hypothetical protein